MATLAERSPLTSATGAAGRGGALGVLAAVLIAISLLLLIVGWGAESLPALVPALFISYAGAWLWCAATLRTRFVFAAFLAPFGLFLLARVAVFLAVDGERQLSLGVLGTNFTDERIVVQILGLLTTSIISLTLGAGLVALRRDARRGVERLAVPSPARVRAVALCIFYVAAPVVMYQALLIARTGQTAGFYEARLSAGGLLPFPLEMLAGMATPAFFAYLAGLPARRAATFHTVVFLGVMAFTLITWQRSAFVLALLLVSVYWYYRHVTAPPGERWIVARYVLIAAVGGVALMGLLAILNSLRGRTRALGLPGGPAVDFLFDQGVSINVIGYSIWFQDSLPHDRYYAFGQIYETIQAYLLPIFGSGRSFSGQTLERAAEGHQLSHAISYFVLGEDYLRGSGYGSSFIAELFVDGGMLAVILGSMSFGILLMLVPRQLNGPFFLRLFVLALVHGVMFAPRGGFTQFIVQALALPFLAVYAILALTYVLTRRPEAELRVERP